MQISAKTDYAIRALLSIADRHPDVVKIDDVANDQKLPRGFFRVIAGDLRRSGLIRIQRGSSGGCQLARDPQKIFVGEVVRAMDGQLFEIHGARPAELQYAGAAAYLPAVWVAVEENIERILDQISLGDLLREAPTCMEATLGQAPATSTKHLCCRVAFRPYPPSSHTI